MTVALVAVGLGAAPVAAADKNPVTRIGGSDRVETALLTFTKNRTLFGSSRAVLTRSDDYADALTATPLASALKAPLLNTRKDKLDPRVLNTLKDQGITEVTLVGGVTALDDGVAQALTSAGIKVDRLAGRDRYDTSLVVAQRIIEIRKVQPQPAGLAAAEPQLVAYVARGDHFADSLGAGGAAGRVGGVLVLSMGDRLTGPINGFLNSGNIRTIAVGGGAAKAVEGAGLEAEKIVGADRADTSAQLARSLPSPKIVLIASGLNFADGLAAGVISALQGGVVILTYPDTLTKSVAEYLAEVQVPVTIIGGAAAVSDDVTSQADVANDGTVPSLPKDPTNPGGNTSAPPSPDKPSTGNNGTGGSSGGGSGGSSGSSGGSTGATSGTGGQSGSRPTLIPVDELQVINKGESEFGSVKLQGNTVGVTAEAIPTPLASGTALVSLSDSTLMATGNSANGLFEVQLKDARGRLLDSMRLVFRNARTPFIQGSELRLATYEGAETGARISSVPGTETRAVLVDASGRSVSGVEASFRNNQWEGEAIRLRSTSAAPAPGSYRLLLQSPDGGTTYDSAEVRLYTQPTIAEAGPITMEHDTSRTLRIHNPDRTDSFEAWTFGSVDSDFRHLSVGSSGGDEPSVADIQSSQADPGDYYVTFDPAIGQAMQERTVTPEQLASSLLVRVTPRVRAEFGEYPYTEGIAGDSFTLPILPNLQRMSDLSVRLRQENGRAPAGFSLGRITDGNVVVTTSALPPGTSRATAVVELVHAGVVVDSAHIVTTPAPRFVRASGEVSPEVTTTPWVTGYVDTLQLDNISTSAKVRVAADGVTSGTVRGDSGHAKDAIVRLSTYGQTIGRFKIELIHPQNDSIVFDTGFANIIAPPAFTESSASMPVGGSVVVTVAGANTVSVPLVAVVVDRFGNIMLPEEGISAQLARVAGRTEVTVTGAVSVTPGQYTIYVREPVSRGIQDTNSIWVNRPTSVRDTSFAELPLTVTGG